MHMLWGILMVAIGLLMLICGSAKSEFVIYRILVERSKMLWGGQCTSLLSDGRNRCYHCGRFGGSQGYRSLVPGLSAFFLNRIGRKRHNFGQNSA